MNVILAQRNGHVTRRYTSEWQLCHDLALSRSWQVDLDGAYRLTDYAEGQVCRTHDMTDVDCEAMAIHRRHQGGS